MGCPYVNCQVSCGILKLHQNTLTGVWDPNSLPHESSQVWHISPISITNIDSSKCVIPRGCLGNVFFFAFYSPRMSMHAVPLSIYSSLHPISSNMSLTKSTRVYHISWRLWLKQGNLSKCMALQNVAGCVGHYDEYIMPASNASCLVKFIHQWNTLKRVCRFESLAYMEHIHISLCKQWNFQRRDLSNHTFPNVQSLSLWLVPLSLSLFVLLLVV